MYDCARFAGIAQLVEQRIRNAKVGSSTLFTGTKFQKATLAVTFYFSSPAKVSFCFLILLQHFYWKTSSFLLFRSEEHTSELA